MNDIPLRTPAAFGALIRDRRRALGLDQAELAARIGVSRLWVNQVERGKPGASISLILRAFAALGVEVSASSIGKPAGPSQPAATPVVAPDIDAVVAAARRNRDS